MGIGYLVSTSLVELYQTGCTGLQQSDVRDVDKQDDGAARRLFHHQALSATLESDDSVPSLRLRDSLRGLFVYLFVFGMSCIRCFDPIIIISH